MRRWNSKIRGKMWKAPREEKIKQQTKGKDQVDVGFLSATLPQWRKTMKRSSEGKNIFWNYNSTPR